MIDHHNFADAMGARDGLAGARFLVRRLTFGAEEISIEHVVNERGLARARYAGDAGKNAKRNFNVDVLQIMLARTGDLDERSGFAPRLWEWNRFAPAQVIARQGVGSARILRAPFGILPNAWL